MKETTLDAVQSLKVQLLNELRDIKVFVLSKGAIEDYYPTGVTGKDKPTKALSFSKLAADLCPQDKAEWSSFLKKILG